MDVFAETSRFGLICFVASAAHQLLQPIAWDVAGLGIPAGLLLLGDIITLPLVVGPMSNDHPWQILRTTFRDVVLVDETQYLCAIPIALVALEAPHMLLLLVVSFVLVYRVFRGRYQLQMVCASCLSRWLILSTCAIHIPVGTHGGWRNNCTRGQGWRAAPGAASGRGAT